MDMEKRIAEARKAQDQARAQAARDLSASEHDRQLAEQFRSTGIPIGKFPGLLTDARNTLTGFVRSCLAAGHPAENYDRFIDVQVAGLFKTKTKERAYRVRGWRLSCSQQEGTYGTSTEFVVITQDFLLASDVWHHHYNGRPTPRGSDYKLDLRLDAKHLTSQVAHYLARQEISWRT